MIVKIGKSNGDDVVFSSDNVPICLTLSKYDIQVIASMLDTDNNVVGFFPKGWSGEKAKMFLGVDTMVIPEGSSIKTDPSLN